MKRKYQMTGASTWEKALRAGLTIQKWNLERFGRAPKISVYRGRDGFWWATWDCEAGEVICDKNECGDL